MSNQSTVDLLLVKIFTHCGDQYLSELKKLDRNKSEWVAFGTDDLDQKDFTTVRDFFLNAFHPCNELHLDKLGFQSSWSNEEIFDRCFENLMEWAGMEIAMKGKKPADFLKEFYARIKKPPQEITLIPMFRMESETGFYLNRNIVLKPLVELVQFDWVMSELLRREFISIRDTYGYPGGFHNMAPAILIKASIPHGSDKTELISKANASVEQFKVLMTGLFGVSLDNPFFIFGRGSAWFPFDKSDGQYSSKNPVHDASRKNFFQWNQDKIHAFEHHWQAIGYQQIRRFRVTAARLRFAEERENQLDRIVDLAVAIEGLFASSEPTSKMILALTFLLSENPDERVKFYETLKDLFTVRGEIVHGNTFEGKHHAIQRYKSMNRGELKHELDQISDLIRKALQVLILNPPLYDAQTRTHFILGKKIDVVRNIYDYRKKSTSAGSN